MKGITLQCANCGKWLVKDGEIGEPSAVKVDVT